LPATKYDAAISWLEHIERLDQYRADGLSHKEIEEIEHREIKRAMEEDPFFRRVNEHHRAGMDYGEAWNLTLAESLINPGRGPSGCWSVRRRPCWRNTSRSSRRSGSETLRATSK